MMMEGGATLNSLERCDSFPVLRPLTQALTADERPDTRARASPCQARRAPALVGRQQSPADLPLTRAPSGHTLSAGVRLAPPPTRMGLPPTSVHPHGIWRRTSGAVPAHAAASPVHRPHKLDHLHSTFTPTRS